jgi:hypothetical protein
MVACQTHYLTVVGSNPTLAINIILQRIQTAEDSILSADYKKK